MALYTDAGRRRILPPLRVRRRCPLAPPPARRALRRRPHGVVSRTSRSSRRRCCERRGGYRIVVDWHEVWTRDYWREYLGRLGGSVGWRVQRACLRVPQRAFCFSRLHERRLRELGLRGEVTRLEGQYDGPLDGVRSRGRRGRSPSTPAVTSPRSTFRHSSRRSRCAREQIPDLRGEIYGDGPEREKVVAAIARARARRRSSRRRDSSSGEVLEDALSKAMCLVLPSRREGYGRVVIEAVGARGSGRWSSQAPTTRRRSSSRRASTGRSRRRRNPVTWPRRIVCGPSRQAQRCAHRLRTGSCATPSASLSSGLVDRVLEAYAGGS